MAHVSTEIFREEHKSWLLHPILSQKELSAPIYSILPYKKTAIANGMTLFWSSCSKGEKKIRAFHLLDKEPHLLYVTIWRENLLDTCFIWKKWEPRNWKTI